MPFHRFFYVIVILTFFSCSKAVETSSQKLDKERVSDEILEMFENYHAAIKADGLKAEFDYLDNSSDFFWVPPGYNSPLSYDEVKIILIENDKAIKTIEFNFDIIQVFPLKNSIANYSGVVSGKMTDTLNNISKFKIIESGTLIKRKDGWKLLNGQSRNLTLKDSL